VTTTDTSVDQGAEFRRLNDRRRELRGEIPELERSGVGHGPTDKAGRLRLLEMRSELAALEKEITDRWGVPKPLGAGASVQTVADLNRRLVGIAVDRQRLGAERKDATSAADLARIDAKLKTLDDEELLLGNQRPILARKAQREREALERARAAIEQGHRFQLYLEADRIYDEILERLDRLDALRRDSPLDDVAPLDFDKAPRARHWVRTFELLDTFRHEVVTSWRPFTMPAVRAWAEEAGVKPAAPPRRKRLGRR
jgi:hypothetical protein